jgi:hypothetical protein
MAIPPRVSVVALRTADLARSTAFYAQLGWKLRRVDQAPFAVVMQADSRVSNRRVDVVLAGVASR